MRIVCESFEDFLLNLELDHDQSLFENSIRVSVSKRDRTEVGEKVYLVCSVLLQTEQAEYLVEYGEFCGYDYFDDSTLVGTSRAESIKETLTSRAVARSWRIRPGILGM